MAGALLIDRGGQLLAMDGGSAALDAVSIWAAVGAVLGEARARPKPRADFAAPLNDTESRAAWTPPS